MALFYSPCLKVIKQFPGKLTSQGSMGSRPQSQTHPFVDLLNDWWKVTRGLNHKVSSSLEENTFSILNFCRKLSLIRLVHVCLGHPHIIPCFSNAHSPAPSIQPSGDPACRVVNFNNCLCWVNIEVDHIEVDHGRARAPARNQVARHIAVRGVTFRCC